MKKILVAGIAAAALISAPALAADYPAKAGPGPAAAFNWSGFYIGVNGGELSSKSTGVFVTIPGDVFTSGRSDVSTAGLHGGFQGQWGNFVAGIEGGFNAALSDKFGSAPPSGGAVAPCAYITHTCDARLNDLLTAGGRLGWAWNNVLLYGSGGFARGVVDIRGGSFGGTGIQDVGTKHHSGSYYGAGIEYGLMNNLTIGVDWKHFDLGHATTFNAIGGNTINVNAKGDAVTARLTIKQ